MYITMVLKNMVGNCWIFWIFLKELEITDGSLILDLLQRTYYNRRRFCDSGFFFLQRTEYDRRFFNSGFFFKYNRV